MKKKALFFSIYVSLSVCMCIYLVVGLPVYLSVCLSHLSNLSTYLSVLFFLSTQQQKRKSRTELTTSEKKKKRSHRHITSPFLFCLYDYFFFLSVVDYTFRSAPLFFFFSFAFLLAASAQPQPPHHRSFSSWFAFIVAVSRRAPHPAVPFLLFHSFLFILFLLPLVCSFVLSFLSPSHPLLIFTLISFSFYSHISLARFLLSLSPHLLSLLLSFFNIFSYLGLLLAYFHASYHKYLVSYVLFIPWFIQTPIKSCLI